MKEADEESDSENPTSPMKSQHQLDNINYFQSATMHCAQKWLRGENPVKLCVSLHLFPLSGKPYCSSEVTAVVCSLITNAVTSVGMLGKELESKENKSPIYSPTSHLQSRGGKNPMQWLILKEISRQNTKWMQVWSICRCEWWQHFEIQKRMMKKDEMGQWPRKVSKDTARESWIQVWETSSSRVYLGCAFGRLFRFGNGSTACCASRCSASGSRRSSGRRRNCCRFDLGDGCSLQTCGQIITQQPKETRFTATLWPLQKQTGVCVCVCGWYNIL